MGLFSKKTRETVVHPSVARSITVPAPAAAVIAQLNAYGDLHSPKRAAATTMRVGSVGEATVVELAPTMHPWTFHNLGFWLLDTEPSAEALVLRAGPSPDHPAYALVRDPEMPDCLCGFDADGDGWTVAVPTNDIVRGEAAPRRPDVGAPIHGTLTEVVEILTEDPGPDLNPTNAGTVATREKLARTADSMAHLF